MNGKIVVIRHQVKRAMKGAQIVQTGSALGERKKPVPASYGILWEASQSHKGSGGKDFDDVRHVSNPLTNCPQLAEHDSV
jgi:hypothetical protein